MVKSLILIAVFLGLLPFLLGLLYTRFIEEEKENLLLQMAAGYIIMFGTFEIHGSAADIYAPVTDTSDRTVSGNFRCGCGYFSDLKPETDRTCDK